MNQEKSLFKNLAKPQVNRMQSHRRRLKVALLTAHENRSPVSTFGNVISDITKPMSLGKKSTLIATVAVFVLVVAAGTLGPKASEVAEAEAVNTVKRAFGHLALLSDEEREQVRERFSGDVRFALADVDPGKLKEIGERFGHKGYMKFDDLTEEEKAELKEKHKVDLEGALEEALAADDLIIIDAEEMPKPGFFGKMGRSFGMHPYKKGGDWMAKFSAQGGPASGWDTDGDGELSEEEKQAKMDQFGDKFKNHEFSKRDYTAKKDYSKPVTFMQYTDSDGNKVTLGVDENDVPVMKYIEGEKGFPFHKFKKLEQ